MLERLKKFWYRQLSPRKMWSERIGDTLVVHWEGFDSEQFLEIAQKFRDVDLPVLDARVEEHIIVVLPYPDIYAERRFKEQFFGAVGDIFSLKKWVAR